MFRIKCPLTGHGSNNVTGASMACPYHLFSTGMYYWGHAFSCSRMGNMHHVVDVTLMRRHCTIAFDPSMEGNARLSSWDGTLVLFPVKELSLEKSLILTLQL